MFPTTETTDTNNMSQEAKKLIAQAKAEGWKRLDLGNCGLTDLQTQVPELFELTDLEELVLSNEWWDWDKRIWVSSANTEQPNLLREIPEAMAQLRQLKVLRCGGGNDMRWEIRDITALKVLKQLTVLDLGFNQIRDISALRDLTQLIKLDLSFNEINHIEVLQALKQLIVLYLNANQISDISALQTLNQLTVLSLGRNRISDISALCDLKQLFELNLLANQISDIGILRTLTQLTILHLQVNQIRDISALRDLKKLTELDLWENQISDISVLKALEKLTKLDLRNNQISDISALRDLKQLTVLHLWENQISDINALRDLKKLTKLDLRNNQISDISALRDLTQLTELDLWENQISDISALRDLKQLSVLDLRNNQIRDIGALRDLTQLLVLDLSGNEISDICPIYSLPQLKYLSIYSNPLQNKFSYALLYINIANFQCIKRISLLFPTDTQFVAFIGENGDGKTSILQAIGLGLHEATDLSTNEKGGYETSIKLSYYNQSKGADTNTVIENHSTTDFTSLPAFAAYGAARLAVSERRHLQNPLLNLITDKARLYDISEIWLRDLAVNEPEQYQLVADILVSLLPNVTAIVKKEPQKRLSDLLFMEKGIAVPLQQLSAGHKSIVLMIGDMMMRLAEAQPEIKDPRDFKGIVLIDEIEAHLHPKWQKEFPQILSRTFPKVQFVVTTHSVISLLGMPSNTAVYRVNRSETEGTSVELMNIDLANLMPNHLLSSPLFDLDIKPASNTDTNQIATTDTYSEHVARQELTEKLRQLAERLSKKEE
jgi:Leucine-rich repeat (LRR) protein